MNLYKLKKFLKSLFEDFNYIVCIFAILMCISIVYITLITNHKKHISELSQFLSKNDIQSFNTIIKSNKDITNFDLKDIYKNYIKKNYIDFTNHKIDETTYVNNLKRIRNLKGVPRDTLISYLSKSNEYRESQLNYSKAVLLMDKKDYRQAATLLSSITDLSCDYNKSIKKLSECSSYIKNEVSETTNDLCRNKKYDDAEKILNENKEYLTNNDYSYILNNLNKNKELYFNSLPTYAANETPIKNFERASSVKVDNINKLDVPSETKYLIYVDISKQKTYIFCGKKNSWIKYKEFTCSTGVQGKETPTGFFKIGMKGKWFFSPKYGQGGKFWTSFKGSNYLFHSVPYDSSSTKVLDSTLGTAASHGCIRLATDDSKFIYDTIPAGTSVIIN